jgi:membrane protein YdbS with pleckstrin-like domain
MTDAPSWVTLSDHEEVVWRGHPVVYHYLGGFLLAAGLLAGAAAAAALWQWASVAPRWIPAGALGALGLLVGLQTLVSRRTIQYLVTTEEVYVKRGLLSREVKNLRLDRVQNSSFKQTLSGRLFSYGDVELDTAGSEDTEIVMRHVANPEAVLGHVSEGMASNSGPSLGRHAGSPNRGG